MAIAELLKETVASEKTQSLPQHGRCHACAFKPRCLPAALDGEALTAFEEIVTRQARLLKAGQVLVRQGERMCDVYAVRVGSLKAVDNSTAGEGRVMSFHFPGSIIGLANLEYKEWTQTVVALEDTALCRIPVTALSAAVQHQLIRLISQSLQREYARHLLLANKGSAVKVATFLLEIGANRELRNLVAARFTLPMPQFDVANYLGMRNESFSRGFTALKHRGLVERRSNQIHLLDIPALRELQTSP